MKLRQNTEKFKHLVVASERRHTWVAGPNALTKAERLADEYLRARGSDLGHVGRRRWRGSSMTSRRSTTGTWIAGRRSFTGSAIR